MNDEDRAAGSSSTRRWAAPAAAAMGALCVAALAVATNLATAVVPDSLPWLKDPVILWPSVGVLVVATMVIAGVAARQSRAEDDRVLLMAARNLAVAVRLQEMTNLRNLLRPLAGQDQQPIELEFGPRWMVWHRAGERGGPARTEDVGGRPSSAVRCAARWPDPM